LSTRSDGDELSPCRIVEVDSSRSIPAVAGNPLFAGSPFNRSHCERWLRQRATAKGRAGICFAGDQRMLKTANVA
jgi:hypothetical protein